MGTSVSVQPCVQPFYNASSTKHAATGRLNNWLPEGSLVDCTEEVFLDGESSIDIPETEVSLVHFHFYFLFYSLFLFLSLSLSYGVACSQAMKSWNNTERRLLRLLLLSFIKICNF